jgi:hypothetical protein
MCRVVVMLAKDSLGRERGKHNEGWDLLAHKGILRHLREPVQHPRQNVVRKVSQELGHSPEPLFAEGTTRNHAALAALRDGRRLVYEVRQVVAIDFCFKGGEQFGLEHGPLLGRGNGRAG